MNKLYIISVVLALVILSSCGSSRRMANRSPLDYNNSGSVGEGYLEQYASIAVDEMRRTGVPASITLAQGIIESEVPYITMTTGGVSVSAVTATLKTLSGITLIFLSLDRGMPFFSDLTSPITGDGREA